VPSIEFHGVRGVQPGIKEATVPGVGMVAVCSGIAAAQKMLRTDEWRSRYVAVEVMACVGGCLGGGGEPKNARDPLVLEKRAAAIYSLDERAVKRCSHDNKDVQALYKRMATDGDDVHALLHTSYAPRGSERHVLARFLDAVDRRDGDTAASLFAPSTAAAWHTGGPVLRGRTEIAAFINTVLPRNPGVLHRHAFASVTSGCAVTHSADKEPNVVHNFNVELSKSSRSSTKQQALIQTLTHASVSLNAD
jgi:NADH-quinone oxidoreductase subunit G